MMAFMPERAPTIGLRERNKRLTEVALVEAALSLFEQHGYDAVSVQEIARAAQVAPRSFFRYFEAKADVLFSDSQADAAMRAVLADPRDEESDVDLIVRAMLCGFQARSRERQTRAFRLVQKTPALQARLFNLIWLEQEDYVQAIAARHPPSREAMLRARVLTLSVTQAVRVGFAEYLGGRRSRSLEATCDRAIAFLRDALAPTSPPRTKRRASLNPGARS
jgi:AcrR family transcriptional regulator